MTARKRTAAKGGTTVAKKRPGAARVDSRVAPPEPPRAGALNDARRDGSIAADRNQASETERRGRRRPRLFRAAGQSRPELPPTRNAFVAYGRLSGWGWEPGANDDADRSAPRTADRFGASDG
jgi:hypothetical protein